MNLVWKMLRQCMAGQKKQRATRITESSLIYAYRVPLLIFRLCQNIVYHL